MKSDEIKDLIEKFNSTDLSFLEIRQDNIQIKMKKGLDFQKIKKLSNSINHIENPANISLDKAYLKDGMEQEEKKDMSISESPSNLSAIRAKLVGVFYASPEPGKEAYVKEGSRVKKGDILGLIEAMKMLSEIKSDVSGVVKKIHIKNEALVSYDMVIMEIEEE